MNVSKELIIIQCSGNEYYYYHYSFQGTLLITFDLLLRNLRLFQLVNNFQVLVSRRLPGSLKTITK